MFADRFGEVTKGPFPKNDFGLYSMSPRLYCLLRVFHTLLRYTVSDTYHLLLWRVSTFFNLLPFFFFKVIKYTLKRSGVVLFDRRPGQLYEGIHPFVRGKKKTGIFFHYPESLFQAVQIYKTNVYGTSVFECYAYFFSIIFSKTI